MLIDHQLLALIVLAAACLIISGMCAIYFGVLYHEYGDPLMYAAFICNVVAFVLVTCASVAVTLVWKFVDYPKSTLQPPQQVVPAQGVQGNPQTQHL